MTTATAPSPVSLASHKPPRRAAMTAFWALTLRDLRVLRRELLPFLSRTIMQPFLLLFVFTYVFPQIGQGIGGSGSSEGAFNSIIMGGLLGSAVIFTGIQAVALPLVQDFGYTREIEDRVMAPLPVGLLAFQKIAAGAIQGMLSALVVFPLALVIPAEPITLHVNWPVLITALPIAAVLGASLGLTIGTKVAPQQVSLVFSLLLIPMTFLGCVYYPWSSLATIKWLQIAVLVNPLVYMSEAFRAALVPIPHMSLWVVYPAMIAFTLLLARTGIKGFRRRVLT